MKLKARILVGMLFALVLFAALARGASASAAHPGSTRASIVDVSGVENSTGTFTLDLENSRDNWATSNGSVVLSIDTNRQVNGLNLTVSSFTAAEDMWWGGLSDLTGATGYPVANDSAKARGQQIIPPGRFDIDQVQLHTRKELNGGSGYQELLIQVSEDDSDLPGSVIGNQSVNLTAIPTAPSWQTYDFSEPLNFSDPFWVILNGSFLFDDRACWCMRGDSFQPDGMEAAHNGVNWVSSPIWDAAAMVRGKRLNMAGTAPWSGDASELACNVSADGGSYKTISSSVLLNSSDVRDGRVSLSFLGNISASTEVSYVWLFTRANETAAEEPTETTPESKPWSERFLAAHGWHAVVLVVVLALTAIIAIILWKKAGPWVIAIGLGVLAAYFAFLVFFPVVVQPMATFYSDSWYVAGSHYNSSTELTQNWWDSGVDRVRNAGNTLINDTINAHNVYWANQSALCDNSSEFWWGSWGDFVDSAVETILGIPESMGSWSLWAVLGGGAFILLAVVLWRGLNPKWTIFIGLCVAAALIGLALAYPSLTLSKVVVI